MTGAVAMTGLHAIPKALAPTAAAYQGSDLGDPEPRATK
jgi:hypothetical protein